MLRPLAAWRIAAAVLWIGSIACLFQAIGVGVTAEESLYNSTLTERDRVSIRQARRVADGWADAGWILQIATAGVLAFCTELKRVVRRIFVGLGVLIAADGILLLLITAFIRFH